MTRGYRVDSSLVLVTGTQLVGLPEAHLRATLESGEPLLGSDENVLEIESSTLLSDQLAWY